MTLLTPDTTTSPTTSPATPPATSPATSPATPEFGDRVFQSMLGAFDVLAIALGDELGLYQPLDGQWLTSTELAAHAGIHERYAREWLEQQCASGVLEVEDPTRPPTERLFTLPPDRAEVLTPSDSTAYITPFARVIASAAVQLPQLVGAYRTGGGVPWADFGERMRTGQGDANRALFLESLAGDWIPAIPGASAALRAGGTVLDVGCGEGWSSIAIALGYPEARVVGVDIDEASVLAARQHAADLGLGERVTFELADAGSMRADGYDLVMAFECVHDMPDPESVLRTMRAAARPGAPVVVMDERVGEQFAGPADEVEQLMYGMSLLICLPDGMSHPGSVGTGTVMRPETLRGYAVGAGFRDTEVLDIDNDLFRFYRLIP